MEIPPQNRAENFASYVLRVCSTIETVRIPLTSEANSFRESTKDKDSRVEKVNGKNIINCIFRLFPIISISQKIFSIFFLTLEKIGIDEKVICCHNISN